MTPSEKEKIIEEGFDAIRKVYNLRGKLLEDAGNLEAARESNRKLSDRVANLEVTIEALNSAIDKKDVEIKRLKEELDLLQKAHKKLYCDYSDLNRTAIVNAGVVHKYNTLCENNAKLEDNFHELREKFARLYLFYMGGMLEYKDVTAFTDWFIETFSDFGVYDEEE